MKKNKDDPRFTIALPPDNGEVPLYRRPETWLEQLVFNEQPNFLFFTHLMDCIPEADIGSVLKYIPEDMFAEFRQMLVEWAEEPEEQFGIPGSVPTDWDQDEVRDVLRWLESNPNPELAPPLAVLKAAAPSAGLYES